MQLTLQIVITDESGMSRTEELMTLHKSGDTRNDIGLSVSESKQLLNTVQHSVVQLQADEYTHNHIQCPHCLAARRIKGRTSGSICAETYGLGSDRVAAITANNWCYKNENL